MTTKVTKAFGTNSAGAPLQEMTIERRVVTPHDVQIEILFCGICHSDLHQVKNDFGRAIYPLVPGHEIVGRVTEIGENVVKFKVGDLAGVGCIVDACRTCNPCQEGFEQFCEAGMTFSFNSIDKTYGGHTFGGYSERIVTDEKYVLSIPKTLDLASTAPLLCAGITVYSPLKHWKVGQGTKIGILGIGGLGHLAIKIAKAMGAIVTVFTTSQSKVEDAKRLGADNAVLSTDTEQMKKYLGKLNFILDTISAQHDINDYLKLLSIDGSLVLVGLPPELLSISAFSVVKGRKNFSGSNIGGIAETQEMLDFCAKHTITADIELIHIQDINKAYKRLENGDVHYRFVIDLATLKN
jgi:uncharacterized zinc-type alcohol dehydrogenase-like protein